jgi:hypothetical protein
VTEADRKNITFERSKPDIPDWCPLPEEATDATVLG